MVNYKFQDIQSYCEVYHIKHMNQVLVRHYTVPPDSPEQGLLTQKQRKSILKSAVSYCDSLMYEVTIIASNK